MVHTPVRGQIFLETVIKEVWLYFSVLVQSNRVPRSGYEITITWRGVVALMHTPVGKHVPEKMAFSPILPLAKGEVQGVRLRGRMVFAAVSDMGIPISKTLVIWASPSHITLAIRVRVTGDAHITRVLGMGMPISP